MIDITPHPDEVNAASTGIYLQLKETTHLVEVYGSLANAIDKLGLYEFIDNQVAVISTLHAQIRVLDNRIRGNSVTEITPDEIE